MVKVAYDSINNNTLIFFKGSEFGILLDIMKNHDAKFDPDTKRWVLQNNNAYLAMKEIQENKVDSIHITPSDFDSIKKNRYIFSAPETHFLGIQLDESLMQKYPAHKGKPPYEDFQIECILRGLSQDKLFLALGMGTGKTYITIQILNHLLSSDKINRIFVVARPEGLVNWKRAFLQFSPFIKDDDICISTVSHNRNPFEKEHKVTILSYRHFLTISDDFYKKNNPKKTSKKYKKPQIPFEKSGNAIVLDESHSIKNRQARQSHVLHLHRQYFDYRFLLTGTPTPNNFSEIYSQIKFLDSSSVPDDYYSWLKSVAELGNAFSSYAIREYKEEEVKRWERIFSKWVIRYRSEDVLDLPPLIIDPVYVELSGKQKEIYRQLVTYVLTAIAKTDEGRLKPIRVLNKFPYISLALDNPLILQKSFEEISLVNSTLAKLISSFKFEKDHCKIEVVSSLLDQYINEEGKKVVLFDFHPLTLNLLADQYKKYNPYLIHGENTPVGQDKNEFRDSILKDFRASKDRNLLIGSSRVLSTSIDLVEASRVIFFSRDFSYLTWSQAIKRFHRIGQTDTVKVNPLVFEYSLDMFVDNDKLIGEKGTHDALTRKQELDETLFSSVSLSLDQWKKVFMGESI